MGELTDQETKTMSFVNPEDFQHILRVQNTNIDGNIKVTHAITSIRGMGRRFTDLVSRRPRSTDPSEPVSLLKLKWSRSKPSWPTQRTSRSSLVFEQAARLEGRQGRPDDQ